MTEENSPAVKKRSGWITLLRIVLVLLFLVIALVGGTAVGFVVLGKQDIGGVFEWSTWQHVFDLVFAP
ncbi:DNA-directed RNA polymerase subunit beta [Fontibacillus phaseoli]|uniref:DNA-directed RNA polymerase subunit beta n=1 Tax=Fontibacillus phaseoli TaxID=1416533 RepID=A0A369BES9_9BACL|nr:DNA-directed RNA polymerase subunit beta [Fontibacillus phaseoli]RCX19108.1 DNA-directed RNA polymerase subunit beta [Fontibacillus phaseoli]